MGKKTQNIIKAVQSDNKELAMFSTDQIINNVIIVGLFLWTVLKQLLVFPHWFH